MPVLRCSTLWAHPDTPLDFSLSPRRRSGERAGERGYDCLQWPSSPRPSPPSEGGEGVRKPTMGTVSRCARHYQFVCLNSSASIRLPILELRIGHSESRRIRADELRISFHGHRLATSQQVNGASSRFQDGCKFRRTEQVGLRPHGANCSGGS